MEKPATIYDVAREAQVSPATVSRVLSGSTSVKPATRSRVLAAIDMLHYTPDISAQRLNNRRNRTISLISPSVKNPYYSAIFAAVNSVAAQYGYSTWLHQLPMQNNIITSELAHELINQRMAGAIISSGFSSEELPSLRRAIALLQEYMPVVAICPPVQNLNCLILSNDLSLAVEKLIKHLYTLGHRRMAFLGGPDTGLETFSRGQAFLRTLHELGLPDIPQFHSHGGYDIPTATRSLSIMLNELPRENYPSAILCVNDLVAIGALQELYRRGLSVPQDIAVTGCDNIFFSQYTYPPLTTIDLIPEQLATDAVSALLCTPETTFAQLIHHYEAPLVIRESCGLKYGPRQFANSNFDISV